MEDNESYIISNDEENIQSILNWESENDPKSFIDDYLIIKYEDIRGIWWTYMKN